MLAPSDFTWPLESPMFLSRSAKSGQTAIEAEVFGAPGRTQQPYSSVFLQCCPPSMAIVQAGRPRLLLSLPGQERKRQEWRKTVLMCMGLKSSGLPVHIFDFHQCGQVNIIDHLRRSRALYLLITSCLAIRVDPPRRQAGQVRDHAQTRVLRHLSQWWSLSAARTTTAAAAAGVGRQPACIADHRLPRVLDCFP